MCFVVDWGRFSFFLVWLFMFWGVLERWLCYFGRFLGAEIKATPIRKQNSIYTYTCTYTYIYIYIHKTSYLLARSLWLYGFHSLSSYQAGGYNIYSVPIKTFETTHVTWTIFRFKTNPMNRWKTNHKLTSLINQIYKVRFWYTKLGLDAKVTSWGPNTLDSSSKSYLYINILRSAVCRSKSSSKYLTTYFFW